MHRLSVLIHQLHPFHQITVHQACNAQGVFDVRIVDDLSAAPARLCQGHPADLLILDQAMPSRHGKALLNRLRRAQQVRALLFIGQPDARRPDFARLARQQGLWVVGELQWPLSTIALSQALIRVKGGPGARRGAGSEMVTLPAHA